jgi:cholesterol oxidase
VVTNVERSELGEPWAENRRTVDGAEWKALGWQAVQGENHYDWIVIGSGFGGSVSALRLAQKGYRVLVVEQGERFGDQDFARSNWNLKRWMWLPRLGFRGIFRMNFFRHVTVLTGVGVGGGSLVYANTLPSPPAAFYQSPAWAHLGDWKNELAPHYAEVLKMLGAQQVPFQTPADDALSAVARDMHREEHFQKTRVSVYFGEEGQTVPDPYFDGAGPERTGCTRCGACMVGCRGGAKNTLDRNYLHLAENLGTEILPRTVVTAVRQSKPNSVIEVLGRERLGAFRHCQHRWTTDRVVLAGGVLGTTKLLFRMKKSVDGLPRLSEHLGAGVMTNSESLTGVTTLQKDVDHSKGVAIGSVLQTDAQSHLEVVRYPAGSGFFRILMAPYATGKTIFARSVASTAKLFRHPILWIRTYFVRDWAKQTTILLYMRSAEESLRLRPTRLGGLQTVAEKGRGPIANIPEADQLSSAMARKLNGVVGSLLPETLFARPTTAHILGGCGMGADADSGVIDSQHRLFGHPEIMVVDGSALSANPGVNPSLTIAAMAELAMSRIAPK